ncbi:putrescine transport system substrate-binding protein [Pseudomonas sp. SLBN-26]|uniref:extracellular solute-binding protein n=1 Tax=Pseudomonadaceae TaxID=135621 RepID=UPI00114ECFC7|nr:MULTISPECIES: extracellular solute-binding protein [Pseudomonas]MCP1621072.1 putrescine transport system substrate-binding protein [Pseudomonas otitidis]TQL10276.1 putrescine transport system substrate-binding protein [Pseudomonas sp. SLBN-26]
MRVLAGLLLVWALDARADEVLRVLNWKNYIEPQVLEAFQQSTGIRVDYRTMTAAEELDAALAAGEAFDVVVPSHFQLARLLREKRLQPLDTGALSHYRQVDPGLLAMLAGIDGANRYAVPYLWGSVGLVINPGPAEAAYGGALPNSWSLLFDERQAARLATCGIALLDAPEETASLWFNYRGRSLALQGPRQIERGLQALPGIARQARYLDNEAYIAALAEGRLCLAMGWVGHALTASARNPALQYRIPDEGAMVFIDSLAIPANAPRPDLALRFIDFLLEPRNALADARASQFYSPLPADSAEQAELARERPMQVLKAEERRRLYLLERLTTEQKAALDKVWAQVKAARAP